jgi:L-lactate dehydrogenase complex protein LldG
MARTDEEGRGATLERFHGRLEAFGVTHETVAPGAVAGAIESAVEAPAVGVPLPEGLGDLPPSVETAFTPATLAAAATGVTHATLGVADYGSLVLPSTHEGVELASLYADEHVAVLDTANVVSGMRDLFAALGPRCREDGTDVLVATGPSATADMGALVTGAHGPKAVHAVLVDRDAEGDA